MSKTDAKIENLENLIKQLLEKEVAPVAVVAPVAPVAPILPLVQQNTGDHDALNTLIGSVADFKTTVNEKFLDLKADIKSLGDGTAARLTECEKGERENSDAIIRINTQMKVWVGALGVFFTILNIVLRIYYK